MEIECIDFTLLVPTVCTSELQMAWQREGKATNHLILTVSRQRRSQEPNNKERGNAVKVQALYFRAYPMLARVGSASQPATTLFATLSVDLSASKDAQMGFREAESCTALLSQPLVIIRIILLFIWAYMEIVKIANIKGEK